MILGTALITIVLTPFVFALTSRLSVRQRAEAVQVAAGGGQHPGIAPPALSKHVVICGHGRVGSNVARILTQLNIPYVITDLDPKTISELRKQEIPCIYGDAGNPKVLYEAGVQEAAALVLAIPDPVATRLAFDHAKRMNPNLDVVARVHSDTEFELLKKKGVSETVRPETEAGLEIVRHILCRLNIPEATVEEVIANERKTCPM